MKANAYRDMCRELEQNEKQITKLEKRNKLIRTAIKAVEAVNNALTPRAERVSAPTLFPREIKNPNIANEVAAVIKDGADWQVWDIGRALQSGEEPTQAYVNSVSNACATLLKNNRVTRVKRGTYRLKFAPRPKGDEVEDLGELKLVAADAPANGSFNIGADTHVRQMPPRGN